MESVPYIVRVRERRVVSPACLSPDLDFRSSSTGETSASDSPSSRCGPRPLQNRCGPATTGFDKGPLWSPQHLHRVSQRPRVRVPKINGHKSFSSAFQLRVVRLKPQQIGRCFRPKCRFREPVSCAKFSSRACGAHSWFLKARKARGQPVSSFRSKGIRLGFYRTAYSI